MSIFSKTILTGLSPNCTGRDTFTALSYLLLPWNWNKWKKGRYPALVVESIKKYFSVSYAFTVDSGRSGLLLSLRALGVCDGDEVVVQGYTCVVVANAIRFAGGVPVYVDIGDDFCIDIHDLRKKITPKTKVIIVQHTFGKAADMSAVMTIAREYSIPIIEDCAHAFGAIYKGKKAGTFGDIAMFSFGSDKVLSSVRGGAVITNNENIAKRVAMEISTLRPMSSTVIFQHLMHLSIFFIGRFCYGIGIGKILLAVAKKMHLINRIIEPMEKRGKQPIFFPALFPNALAHIAYQQIQEVDQINTHRKSIAQVYDEKLKDISGITLPQRDGACIYLRYTICVKDSVLLRKNIKKKHIHLGDWYDTVIAPKDSDMAAAGYVSGSCPHAEDIAHTSVNLPTGRHISEQDAQIIIDALRTCLPTQSNK